MSSSRVALAGVVAGEVDRLGHLRIALGRRSCPPRAAIVGERSRPRCAATTSPTAVDQLGALPLVDAQRLPHRRARRRRAATAASTSCDRSATRDVQHGSAPRRASARVIHASVRRVRPVGVGLVDERRAPGRSVATLTVARTCGDAAVDRHRCRRRPRPRSARRFRSNSDVVGREVEEVARGSCRATCSRRAGARGRRSRPGSRRSRPPARRAAGAGGVAHRRGCAGAMPSSISISSRSAAAERSSSRRPSAQATSNRLWLATPIRTAASNAGSSSTSSSAL